MIPTPKDISTMWNAYSALYSKKFERNNLPFGVSLANMLQIFEEKPENILEIACGSGLFNRYLVQNLEHECTLTAIDIAEEMIALAKEQYSKFPSLSNVKVTYEVGNSEELTNVADESVDCYIANLCLHLTSDPQKMLQELKRVLKKGKRFGLSVLGPADRVTFLGIFPSVVKELEEEIPELKPKSSTRSVFHLGKREDLMKLVEEAGLKIDYCWSQRASFDCVTEDDFEGLIMGGPGNKKLFESLGEKEQKRVLETLRKKVKENFIDKKDPAALETLFVVGTKQ